MPHKINRGEIGSENIFYQQESCSLTPFAVRLTVETVLLDQFAVRLDGTNIEGIALWSRDATLIRGRCAGSVRAGVDCGAVLLRIQGRRRAAVVAQRRQQRVGVDQVARSDQDAAAVARQVVAERGHARVHSDRAETGSVVAGD